MKYFDLLKMIKRNGKEVTCRGLKTKEMLNVHLDVTGYNFFATPGPRPFEEVSHYLFGGLAWHLSGERDIEKILPYSKFWNQIRNKNNTANSNYGDLVFYRKNKFGITSFNWALNCLVKDKETRKAIVLYNERDLFYADNRDLICNQYQHFLIRDNKLICVVSLRSSDAIFGLTFNAPWWSLVHQQMLLKLRELKYPDLELGGISANISSSHYYENKYELVDEILGSHSNYYFLKLLRRIPLGKEFEYYESNIRSYFSVEEVSFDDVKKR